MMYSVVEGRSIEEANPKAKDKVHVRDSNGTWEGIIYTSGRLNMTKFSLHMYE